MNNNETKDKSSNNLVNNSQLFNQAKPDVNETENQIQKVRLPKDASELVVITRAKDLVKYIVIATNKSPKHFRHTMITRILNYAYDIVDNLYRANDTSVKKGDAIKLNRREEYQRRAITSLKLLEYICMLANEVECILTKQFIQISKKGAEVFSLINNWIASDKRRFA